MRNIEAGLYASTKVDIQKHIDGCVNRGLVLWDANSSRQRIEVIDGMPYTFNLLPSLAKKTLATCSPQKKSCFLCDLDSEQTIQLTDVSASKLRINNFPYHETQTLFGHREHTSVLDEKMMIDALNICNDYQLNCSFSTHNAGASFPDHVHIHMFGTELPLYDLEPVWHVGSPIKVGTIAEFPASIIVIESSNPTLIIRQLFQLLSEIGFCLYGYNLQYNSKRHRLYFFPRQTGPSEIFDGQVFGAPTVSGIFTPDARGYLGASIEEAILLIEERYNKVNGQKLKMAIEEIVFPKEFGLDVIIPNVRQP